MLHIAHPSTYLPERAYIYDTILRGFLGLEFRAQVAAREDVVITLADDPDGARLTLPDTLFQTPESLWLTAASLPGTPVPRFVPPPQLVTIRSLPGDIPIIFGDLGHGRDAEVGDQAISLGADLFGSAMFMLSRYEEVARPEPDRHQRYPATASLAYRDGFLDRPVVNEYVELLWSCLSRLWPRLERRSRTGRVLVSHDVDWPVVTRDRSLTQVAKAAAGDLARRRDPELSFNRLRSWVDVNRGRWDRDVGNTFDFMMDENERHGLRSAFYFIAGHTAGSLDGVYSLDDAWIQALLRRVADRGHEIGLHPSYHTYLDPAATKSEFDQLRRVCARLGIEQPAWGGRQHYLRWQNPETWQNWSDAGLAYDSTLGFADEAGFRCGVCYEYPVFNLRSRQALPLRERPLIVMDATLIGDSDRPGGSLSLSDAVARIGELRDRCARFDGDFTLLWHNTWLLQRRQRSAYRASLDLIAG